MGGRPAGRVAGDGPRVDPDAGPGFQHAPHGEGLYSAHVSSGAARPPGRVIGMDLSLAIHPGRLPLVICGLRVVDMSLDTLRVLLLVRGRRVAVWVLGFSAAARLVV